MKPITSRPAMVIAGLAFLAFIAFLGVTRLVNRFGEQQKALARHLYQRGIAEQREGKPELAIEHFRDALNYSPDNFDYQLQLARALRDSGRTQEAETYLVNLWERTPQDGTVNLALGRLAARQGLLDKTIQYYHNAIYGVWSSDPDQRKTQAWVELIEFLLRENARPQAQAELITLAAELPPEPELKLRVAEMFFRAQDNERSLAEYEQVLKIDQSNERALAGAGQVAFRMGRFRTAVRYLKAAAQETPEDPQVTHLLEVSELVVARDPFQRDLSTEERSSRLMMIFDEAGERLDSCAASGAKDTSELKEQWTEVKRRLARRSGRESVMPDEELDLVMKIEQTTQSCAATPIDEALLLLGQNRRSEP